MGSIIPTTEFLRASGRPVYIYAVDVANAYDSVNRASMEIVLRHIGLWDNFYI